MTTFWRLTLGVLAVAAVFVPFRGIPLGGYVRGMAGDISISSIFLLTLLVLRLAVPSRREMGALCAFVLSGAAFLYPMALGLTAFDPYSLGYRAGGRALVLVLAAIALIAWIRRLYLLLAALVLAVGAWRLGILESSNLWDYLFDPWLSLYMVSWLGRFTIFGRSSKSR